MAGSAKKAYMTERDPRPLRRSLGVPSTETPLPRRMLVAGDWVMGTRTRKILDPQDGSQVAVVVEAGHDDVERALQAATLAARAARTMPARDRAEVLRRASQMVDSDAEGFARVIARESVKTIREARQEVARCVITLRLASEETERLGGETLRFDAFGGGEHRSGYWTRDPVGVLAAITPFNDPLNLVAHKVGPALAAGNAVIVKPHEETPLSALRLAAVLVESGVPRGMLQVLTGDGPTVGEALVGDERVHMVSFTGGRLTGDRIARTAGAKKMLMELGGVGTSIVMEDANLEEASTAIIGGAFSAAGQNCLHVQRLLIHRALYEDLRDRLVEAALSLRVGDKLNESTDMGPLINEPAAERVTRLVEHASSAGAKVLTGGRREGTFVSPTLIERVPDTEPLAREEVFGPVTILRPFDSVEEAIGIANTGNHGLQAGIFTQSIDTALHAVRRLETAGVIVNDSGDYRIDAMPFGGRHGSGIGREGVRYAAEAMSEPKVVCFNVRRGESKDQVGGDNDMGNGMPAVMS